MFKSPAGRAVPQRTGSETTRRQILDVALALFRERGFEKTTMRDVAEHARVSPGAAYYYFDSKETLVAAYYDHVQHEHLARARARFADTTDLRERLRAAFHTKIDIVRDDRPLLRALFRFGGDPGHPLSWFGPATREQRVMSVAVFAEAMEHERLPDDLKDAAPTLLWALHMGVLLYFLHDRSPDQARTRALIDAAVGFAVDVRRVVTSPLMRPMRRRVMGILNEAGLVMGVGSRQ